MSDKVEEEIFWQTEYTDCKSASVGGPFFFNSTQNPLFRPKNQSRIGEN